MEREALKLALITLEGWDNHDKWVWPETALEQAKRNTKEAITAIKEALAQPAQEPRNVRERWNVELDGNDLLVCFNDHEKGDACQYERYSPQREWVGLTEEDIFAAVKDLYGTAESAFMGRIDDIATARAIEAKLKEKNT